MHPAIADIVTMIDDIVANVGAINVKNEMQINHGWRNIDENNISDDVASFLTYDVDDIEFGDMLETVYSEFYNIAHKFNYTITTFD